MVGPVGLLILSCNRRLRRALGRWFAVPLWAYTGVHAHTPTSGGPMTIPSQARTSFSRRSAIVSGYKSAAVATPSRSISGIPTGSDSASQRREAAPRTSGEATLRHNCERAGERGTAPSHTGLADR
jgi:hypothetical protein